MTYIQTFTHCPLNTRILPSFLKSSYEIVEVLIKFSCLKETFTNLVNFSKKKDFELEIFNSFEQVGRVFTYFMSANAFRLVQAPAKQQTGDDKLTKEEEVLIHSNLLAGGMEDRFVSLFDEETSQRALEFSQIENFNENQSGSKKKSQASDPRDTLIQHIFTEEGDEDVDNAIREL